MDVGVQKCTPELIKIFPELKHHLFEINPFFQNIINQNYRHLDYTLYIVGLSDKSSELFAISRALRNDGVITHTGISPERPEVIDGKRVVKVETVKTDKFSNLNINYSKNFFLKIDVDGHDLEVASGFEEHLNNSSLIQIESTYKKLEATIKFFSERDFRLLSIVDQMYYGAAIWQCDLIFARNDLITNDLAPNIHKDFKNELWRKMS